MLVSLRKPFLFWLALALALALIAACAKNPVTGEQELVLMSERQELAMGARYYPKTTQLSYGEVPHAPGLQAYVNRVGQHLALGSHRPRIPWEFNVVNTSQVNAYALPGGKISVTRGLLTNMDSEDEMASVLAHEIGHVTARHSVAQYTRGALLSLAVAGVSVALAGSEYRQIGALAAGIAGSLLMLSYSRDQERQADQLGYVYMVKSRYNPKGQVEAFEMMQSMRDSHPGFIANMLSSHPLTTERIETANKRVEMTDRRLVNQPLKVQQFQKAIAHLKDTAPAYAAMDKGIKAYARKNFSEAEQWYKKAITLYPAEGLFHARLAAAEARAGRLQLATRRGRAAARQNPEVFYTNYVAGMAYLKAGDPARALDYLMQADRLLPGHAANQLMMGVSYEKIGSRYLAVQSYRQVVRTAPKSKAGSIARGRLYRLGSH